MCNKKTQGRSKCFVIYICKFVFLCCILSDLPRGSNGITTTYYSKPSNSKSYREDYKIQNDNIKFPNISVSERQKRLLPYINHYVTQQSYQVEPYPNNQQYNLIPPRKATHQQSYPVQFNELIGMAYDSPSYNNYNTQQPLQLSNIKFTPFSSNNALPGSFVPMIKPQPENIEVSYVPFEQSKKIPNYSAIYDKLSQIKLRQNAFLEQYPRNQNPRYIINRKPQVNYIPEQVNYVPVSSIKPQANYVPEQINYVPVSTVKPYTGAYNTVVADVPIKQNIRYEIKNYDELPEQISITENPLRIAEYNNPNLQPIAQPLYQQIPKPQIKFRPQPNYIRILTKNPETNYVLQSPKQYHTQSHRQYLQEVVPSTIKPLVLVPQNQIPQIQYEPKPVPKPIVILEPTLEPVVTHNGQNYEPIPNPTVQHFPTIITTTPIIPTENPNSLSLILQKLQASNTLPHTLTPENIDNSIKTLVRILSSLKSQKKVIEPIVVAEEGDYETEQENETNNDDDGQLKQIFPAENLEGGTPGKPGIDYPALSTIPHTSFNCTTQRYKGFFADPETLCQVWHYCDLNGGQASFLCPNGTIFSQVALTCDWWYNVKCSTTTQLYVLNERLYKYIIPLTPKFPEDYTGPLVDKYLALKFKEMEEKMKEKAEKESSDDKTEEIDELQLLEDKNNESSTSGTKK